MRGRIMNENNLSFISEKKFQTLVAKRIKECREEQIPPMTQFELAARSKLHLNTIKKIERGASSPSIYSLYKISLSFGMELEELVEKI